MQPNHGIHIPEEYIQHISPFGWEHIALTAAYIWNLNQKVNFKNLLSLRKNRTKKKYVKILFNIELSF
ncbi:hypothetical protein BK708_12100 [Bacillus thuringiensis serovar yunnanensis]|nr:hypothetical protein BK708_12100 [Bacillus thuringiensis serovar yunnanensis]